MNTAMKLLLRVVARKIRQGENAAVILSSYSKLTEAEKAILLEALSAEGLLAL